MPNWMARQLLSQRASAGGKPGSSGAREPAATKKPWGRFWYRGTPNQALQQTAGACRTLCGRHDGYLSGLPGDQRLPGGISSAGGHGCVRFALRNLRGDVPAEDGTRGSGPDGHEQADGRTGAGLEPPGRRPIARYPVPRRVNKHRLTRRQLDRSRSLRCPDSAAYIREAGQFAMLEPACESSSLARPADQLLDWSWKSGLKVQQLGPKRRDLDTSHLLVHLAHLRLKSIPPVGSDTLSRCSEVFGRYAIHYIDGGSTSHEQNMRRESVRINGKCHLRICFQCRNFGKPIGIARGNPSGPRYANRAGILDCISSCASGSLSTRVTSCGCIPASLRSQLY